MAGEPILIVDDTPVNLKLTRMLLVNEGYKVLTAASAEEALELLCNYHPRLVLADIQLPGIDGLEMTRRIKRDLHTRDITVVALTAFAMKGDEEKAIQAGCDGYITKPIDTRTLGASIREILDRSVVPPAPEPSLIKERETVPDEEMQALRRRFLSEGQEGVRRLLLELDGTFHAAEGARAVHQWIGTGGLLGYSAIARLARDVATLLHDLPVDTAQVRESLTSLALAFATPREARDAPMPGAILETLAARRVALVGLPAHETERFSVALEHAAAHSQFFELSSTPDPVQLENCDLVVTYVHPQWANSAWLDPAFASGRPTLFVGTRDHLLALEPAVQAMAAEFLMDSWQPDEALVRLSLALNHTAPPTPAGPPAAAGGRIQVLVASGDATVQALVRTALQSAGMEVHQALNGPDALGIARRLNLQAAVLDVSTVDATVERTGMDGYEVLSALRTERRAMRIVMLTAQQQESGILRGVALGADDYLVKPFSPLELVARLKRPIAR